MAVKRFDMGTLRKPKRLANGFLRVDAFLTRTGIFEYRKPDGGVRRELRLDSEVFDAEALESFALNPVTDDHPPEMLAPANARDYQRGNLGETVRRDGDLVRASMLITDAALIAKMEAGKHQVSCGYTCDLDEVPGEWNGQRYDAIQRNIRGNHVAVVETGRAGSTCSVRMDAGDAFGGSVIPQETQAMDEVQKKLDAALAEVAKQTARADAAEEKLSKETARADAAEASIPARVTARVALVRQASEILGSEVKFDDMTDREVKVAVIEKSTGRKLDAVKAKDEVYVGARFDHVLETPETSNPALEAVRVAAENAARTDTQTIDINAARERAKKNASEAWKK